MAPVRRYLRISKHSVLECRIFLENPADESRWLLRPKDPALPRVVEAIRPLVLPKLREENERAKGKGKKKNRVKDVVSKDDFEVSIFLTPIGTRHSLITKNKTLLDQPTLAGISDTTAQSDAEAVIIREENADEEGPPLDQLPGGRDDEQDDKKKMGFKTMYEGFSIWGWVLCLLVTRKGTNLDKKRDNNTAQALMEDWIASTQQQDDI